MNVDEAANGMEDIWWIDEGKDYPRLWWERKPGTLDELAKRRQRMNPRLSVEWLRYLVTVGGRRDADGWRWKLDPSMRFGGFGNVVKPEGAPDWALKFTVQLLFPK